MSLRCVNSYRLQQIDGIKESGKSSARQGASSQSSPPRSIGRLLAALRTLRKSVFPDKHVWKSEDQYTLASNSDRDINGTARVNAAHRNVPKHHQFTMKIDGHVEYERSFGSYVTNQSLKELTLSSRLDLHGHGTTGDYEWRNDQQFREQLRHGMVNFERLIPRQLAKQLQQAGLTEVGILKLHSCSIGKYSFLEGLRDALTELNIKVGYISGPKYVSSDFRIPVKVFGLEFVVKRFPLLLLPLPRKIIWKEEESIWKRITPEKFRLKTVKGNVDIRFPGTRYNFPYPSPALEKPANAPLSTTTLKAVFGLVCGAYFELIQTTFDFCLDIANDFLTFI